MRTLAIILAITVVSLGGCRLNRPNYSLSKSKTDRSNDQLWRDGYGFNNPNPDRIERGLDPVSFNGRMDDSNVGERAIGNAVSFAIFEGIPSFWRGLTKR